MSFEIGVLVLVADAVALSTMEDVKKVVVDRACPVGESLVDTEGLAAAVKLEAAVAPCPDALVGKSTRRERNVDGRDRRPNIDTESVPARRLLVPCSALTCIVKS